MNESERDLTRHSRSAIYLLLERVLYGCDHTEACVSLVGGHGVGSTMSVSSLLMVMVGIRGAGFSTVLPSSAVGHT